ncbi:MAG: 50S ribosomal protein L17 [Microgenomates group bacterium GW2011_GWA2_37_6]|nr:MAG: 50S ribosomal protein L17 [Microgenomates group bacterium GW2011_GWA2_37_6]
MRKQIFGRKFKRDKNERRALFSGLISAMVLNEKINTTEEKAKAIRADLEKLVTKAKKGEGSRRLLASYLKPNEVDKMIYQIGPTFKERSGGYTRIIKTGKRFSDNASMALMQWVEDIQINQISSIRQAQDKKIKSQKSETSERKTKTIGRSSIKDSKRSGSTRAKTAKRTVRKTSSKGTK